MLSDLKTYRIYKSHLKSPYLSTSGASDNKDDSGATKPLVSYMNDIIG